MEKKISDVMVGTGESHTFCKRLLEENKWNVSQSIKNYRFMQNAKPPGPAGSQKNLEQELANAAASTGGGGPMSNKIQHSLTVVPGSPSSRGRLKRGLSKTNENLFLVNKARDIVLNDITESATPSDTSQHFVDTPEYTFILPDLTIYPDDFRAFLHKDLIETSTLVSLEQAGRLNWWAEASVCQRLMPLATTGDGNCLLHAASLAMWGFHDRLLTLRTALFQNLTQSMSKGSLWRRWRWHQTQVNKQSGLVYTDKEWQAEWENLLKLASDKPRTTPGSQSSCCNSPSTKGLMERVGSEKEVVNGGEEETELFYESLEELHVFILAHVLRRPVIVVADTILKDSNGEALAPIPFGGIYLPLLCQPKECHRSPLLLTYDASHFSALVAMENTQTSQKEDTSQLPRAIPLVDPDMTLLPIHYMVDPGPDTIWGKHDNDEQYIHSLQLTHEQQLRLVQTYLDTDRLPGSSSHTGAAFSEDGSVESRESRSRTNSCASSLDSDENSCNSAGSSKGTKVGGKVARKLGSIGKSMGKRLRRNLGANKGKLNGIDTDRSKMPPPMYPPPRKPSTTATQTSRSSTYANDGDTGVLVTRLSDRRVKYQDELVHNYLQAAEERFKIDREQKQQQEAEIIARGGVVKKSEGLSQMNNTQRINSSSASGTLNINVNNTGSSRTQCINTGCTKIGSSVTSYLCQQCFDQQRKEALNLQKSAPMASSVQVHQLNRHDTLFTTGKSKFYTEAGDEKSETPSTSTITSTTTFVTPATKTPTGSVTTVVTSLNKNAPPKTAPKPATGVARPVASNGLNNKSPTGITVAAAKAGFYNNSVNVHAPPVTNTTHNNNRTNMEITRNNLLQHNGTPNKSPHVRWGSYANSGASTLPRGFRANSIDDDLKEPPLRPEFVTITSASKPDNSLTRQAALKIKNSDITAENSEATCDVTSDANSVVVNGVGIKSTPRQESCRTKGCDFFGSEGTDFLCSACYKEKHNARQTKF